MTRRLAVATSVAILAVSVGSASIAGAQQATPSSTPSQTSPPVTSQSAANSSTKPKPKKVWTNDNVSDASGTISVVGSANSSSSGSRTPKGSSKPAAATSVDPRVVASLRDQLQRLQAQLNVVDRQYSDLKAQSKGESKSAGGLQANTFNYDSSSVEEQLQHLQTKKKRIEDTIDQLLEAARKAGIEPGDLR
jgi:chromosome segregation ATPase